MNARELAASKALYVHNTVPDEPSDLPVDEFDCCAVDALYEADEADKASGIHRVVLDEDAVEGLAQVLSRMNSGSVNFLTKEWEDASIDEEEKDYWRDEARHILWYLRREAL